jgi:chromate reductase
MKFIIAGTNRKGSTTLKLSQYMQQVFKNLGEDFEIIDLAQIPLADLTDGSYKASEKVKPFINKMAQSQGTYVVVPEYNGSYPGVLKLFIDHWKYPDSFEHRPVAFLGLGGMFGGMRPVEHIQQVFGYRNAFIYPDRLFLQKVEKVFNGQDITDPVIKDLLNKQASGFLKFCTSLQAKNLIPQL